MWSTHSNLSRVIDRFGRISLLPRKRNFRLHPQHDDRSICGSPSSFSPTLNQRRSRLKPSFYQEQATRLTGHIFPAYDWYIQYLLADANPSVLNQHRRGLQPPKNPARSLVIQSPHKPIAKSDVKHLLPNLWPFNHPASTEVYIYG
jgi:hypothetical protein